MSGCTGAGRDWHSHTAVGEVFTASKQRHSAISNLVITGTANALPTAFFHLLWPMLWYYLARRAASSAAKAHAKATALAQQLCRPLGDLTNDPRWAQEVMAGWTALCPWVFLLLSAALPEEESVALRVVMHA